MKNINNNVDIDLKNIVNNIDTYIYKIGKTINDTSEATLQEYMPNYKKTKEERLLYELYRIGFCGDACDATIDFLKSMNIKNVKKVNPTKEHYFLIESRNNLIIDPTYKQFFYRYFIDTSSGELKNKINLEEIKKINNYPGVFVGTQKELKDLIYKISNDIGKPNLYQDILKNWNIVKKPTNKFR